MNFKSELRNLKIKIINSDVDLSSFDPTGIKRCKKYLKFVSDVFPDDVITGSLALNLYGILDRDIADIDILIKDVDRFDYYDKGDVYGVDIDGDVENRLGYRRIKYRTFLKTTQHKIDFFIDDNSPYNILEFKGKKIKVSKVIDILKTKIELSVDERRYKHKKDLICIFSNIEE